MLANTPQRRSRTTLPVALIAMLMAAAVLFAGCRGMRSEQPPMHPNWNMDNTTSFMPQEPNPFFADGRSMRTPPSGTVPHGHLNESDHYYRGVVSGEPAMELPAEVEVDQALFDRGEARFDIYCTPCHGGAGYGDGMVQERGYLVVAPSFHDDERRALSVGQIFQAITDGVRVPNMPSYADQIPVADRWAIVAYVRALQLSQSATADMARAAAE